MSFNKHFHICLFHLIKFNYFYRWTREKIKLLAQGHLTSWMQMESTTGLLALQGCTFPTTKQCLQEATCSSWQALPPSPLKFFLSKSQENWVAEYLILLYFGNTCFQKEIWWFFFLNNHSSRTRVFPNKDTVQKLFAFLAVFTHSLWMQLHFPSSVFSEDSDGIKKLSKVWLSDILCRFEITRLPGSIMSHCDGTGW